METMKIKPFPWMCPECRQKTVSPLLRDYQLPAVHDGSSYDVVIRQVQIPTCSQCGQAVITVELSERIDAELRRVSGILAPEEIRTKREKLGISLDHLAVALRVDAATLKNWEEGMQLQPRAVDLLMRLYFDSAEVRKACQVEPFSAPARLIPQETHASNQ